MAAFGVVQRLEVRVRKLSEVQYETELCCTNAGTLALCKASANVPVNERLRAASNAKSYGDGPDGGPDALMDGCDGGPD